MVSIDVASVVGPAVTMPTVGDVGAIASVVSADFVAVGARNTAAVTIIAEGMVHTAAVERYRLRAFVLLLYYRCHYYYQYQYCISWHCSV